MTDSLDQDLDGSLEPVADEYPDRPHLRDSRQLNWSRTTKSPEALQVIDQLRAEFEAWEKTQPKPRKRARNPTDQTRLTATLAPMALDLIYAADQTQAPWLAYSRREGDYGTALTRYLSPDVTFTPAVKFADFLMATGYAEWRPGSFSRTDHGGGCVSGQGYRSRLRATPKLVELFTAHGVSRADIEDGASLETIRLKGSPEGAYGRKPLLPYEDTDGTRRMRQQLKDWATVVNGFEIAVAHTDLTEDIDADTDTDEEEASEYADPTTATLYRVFNDGVWTRGGRFYGGWWQSLPKAVRRTITINGEPTIELDFKSLHPRLLYHLAKQPVPADLDPYAMGEPWQGVDRAVVKVAFNQLLAITGDGTPKKPAKAQLPRGTTYKALVEAIEAKHAPISGWFRRGRASELQNIDAHIAEKVLGYVTVIRGRPVLPIHDSFIVAQRDERLLGETMCLAYRGIMNSLTDIAALPVITGWTCSETKQAAYAPLLAAKVA